MQNNLEDKKCPGCDLPLTQGVALSRLEPESHFPYLKVGESAHLECYLEIAIEEIIKNKLEL